MKFSRHNKDYYKPASTKSTTNYNNFKPHQTSTGHWVAEAGNKPRKSIHDKKRNRFIRFPFYFGNLFPFSLPSSLHPSHSQGTDHPSGNTHQPGKQVIRHLREYRVQTQCREHSDNKIIRHHHRVEFKVNEQYLYYPIVRARLSDA